MKVDEKSAAGKAVYGGTIYYFCSPSCLQKFEATPTDYIKGGGRGRGSAVRSPRSQIVRDGEGPDLRDGGGQGNGASFGAGRSGLLFLQRRLPADVRVSGSGAEVDENPGDDRAHRRVGRMEKIQMSDLLNG